MKPQRKELLDATMPLMKNNAHGNDVSSFFAREDRVKGRNPQEKRRNSVQILKATANFLARLKKTLLREE